MAPQLRDGESIVWQAVANRAQGLRTVGGKLCLTQGRLLFVPSRLNALVGGRAWDCELAEITDLAIVDQKSRQGLGGGFRSRLAVSTAGAAKPQLLLINDVPDVIDTINARRRA